MKNLRAQVFLLIVLGFISVPVGAAEEPVQSGNAVEGGAAATDGNEEKKLEKTLAQEIWTIRGDVFKVTGKSLEERKESLRKNLSVALEKIEELRSREMSQTERVQVYKFQSEMLRLSVRADAPEAQERIDTLLKELSISNDAGVQDLAQEQSLLYAFDRFSSLTAEEQAELMQRGLVRIQSLGQRQDALITAAVLGQHIETAKDQSRAADLYGQFAECFAAVEDESFQKTAERFRAAARRLNLPGTPMQVTGTTSNGEPFDIAQYKGKVVLVDFWATWCGPCLAEFPTMERLYRIYHPHGFEIVGISLDENHEHLKKFLSKREIPWIVLHQEVKEGERAWNNDTAKYYGVHAIPVMILIGVDGNVITTHARGEDLEEQLRLLFPGVVDPEG